MTCTCTGGPYVEGAPLHEESCPQRGLKEMIPGQPCPYCGEGSMIHHADGIGSWCDKGWSCKQPRAFPRPTPARVNRARVEAIIRDEIACLRCERHGYPTEQDEDGIFWHHYIIPEPIGRALPEYLQGEQRRECNASALHRILKAINELPRYESS